MRKVLALARAAWLTALSYRLETFFTFVGLGVAVVPVYFISRALQPMMQGIIHTEASEYFGFVIVGLVAFTFVQTAVSAMHGALGGEVSTGSLEALIATPTSIPELLGGMVGYAFSMTAIRGVVVFLAAWGLGLQVVWSSSPAALFILVMLVLVYLPAGILSAALVLAFRTTGPFPGLILGVSGLLGGVYYPTHVVPSWLQGLTAFVPLTYGLRSLRRSLLEGMPLSASAFDLMVLGVTSLVMMAVSLTLFSWALRFAKRAGTLAQY